MDNGIRLMVADQHEEWDTPTLKMQRTSSGELRFAGDSWDTPTGIIDLNVGSTYCKITDGTIREYIVDRVIGQGGTATVYQVHTPDGRPFAIKEIKLADDRANPERAILARFIREARIMTNLHHPNILPIVDQWHSPFRYWLVMPYVSGGTLYERLHPTPTDHRILPVPVACAYALQLLDALHVAHQQYPPIIHRDLKPSNILIDGEQPDHLIIADWGNAHEIGYHLTQHNASIGTPAYMAPEQLYQRSPYRQDDPIGPWTDIYAVGICLYEMLAGLPPFSGTSNEAIALAQLNEPPDLDFLQERNPHVNRGLAFIIGRAMDKQPRRRYQTARAFADALGVFVD